MAYRRFQLPSLKLTRRPTAGEKVYEVVQRGATTGQDHAVEEHALQKGTGVASPPPILDDPIGQMDTGSIEPTGHELEERSQVAGWEAVRSGILRAVTEACAMPLDCTCCVCSEVAASVRCMRCGPAGYYCPECFELYHRQTNIFHVAEKWEGDHYEPFVQANRHIDVRPEHICGTKREVPIDCVDEIGVEHKIFFSACSCEPLPITLARAELWPATPHNPRFAFTFSLLNWAEILLLECQVALKDFCSSLKFISPFNVLKKKGLYSALINSFEEYRLLKHKLRHLDYVVDDLNAGNVCPACPKEDQNDGTYVCSMDALFGLPRKKSAGCSYRDALHKDLFLCEQSTVDEFVAVNEETNLIPSACNDFLAGSMLRSANRYRALDETALFGYCCRHEFPGRFISLKHGERLAYAVWMLENILHSQSQVAAESQVYVMYDIACILSGYLKTHHRSDIQNAVHLCLPTFHAYGHKVSCQVLFGPRRCEGIGLSDGETMERLWSFLRRFGRMTKEMRPAHRADILTSALVYYGLKTKEKLAMLLLTRWEKAIKTKGVAEETLHQLMPQPYNEMETKVKEWLSSEVASCDVPKRKTKLIQWHVGYFCTLQNFHAARNQLAQLDDTTEAAASYRKLALLNKTLMEYEKKYSIPHRWLPSDKAYKDCESSVKHGKSEQLLLDIWKAGQRRMFLLKLVKKYADGQKIAKKLSTQITKESRSIRGLLEKYSMIQTTDVLTVQEALDPQLVESRLQEMGLFCNTMASGGKKGSYRQLSAVVS